MLRCGTGRSRRELFRTENKTKKFVDAAENRALESEQANQAFQAWKDLRLVAAMEDLAAFERHYGKMKARDIFLTYLAFYFRSIKEKERKTYFLKKGKKRRRGTRA